MNRIHLGARWVLAAALVATFATGGRAEQYPSVGAVINADNIETYADLFSPGMRWIIERGVEARMGEYIKIEWSPPMLEATEQYSGQVNISADGTHIENYVAGLPFPGVAADHDHAGIKMMYNFDSAVAYDDTDVRNFDCRTGDLQPGKSFHVERQILIEHFRRMWFTGRLEVDPKPSFEPNKDNARMKQAVWPIVEPFDLKGAGFVTIRSQDYTRADDAWMYLPFQRKVRRLASSQRSDATFGMDFDLDSYGGFSGNVAWSDWTLLGEKTIVASFHAEHMPVVWGEPPAEFFHSDLWEPRNVWVIEGRSKVGGHAFSKRVVIIDKESFLVANWDIYDEDGELWKVGFNQYKFAHKPIADAETRSPWRRRYFPSSGIADLQLGHITTCALPSHRVPSEEGWYINVGETTEAEFDLATLISSSR